MTFLLKMYSLSGQFNIAWMLCIIESYFKSLCIVPTDSSLRERKQLDKEERLSLVLWKRPLTTLQYFCIETLITLKEWTWK